MPGRAQRSPAPPTSPDTVTTTALDLSATAKLLESRRSDPKPEEDGRDDGADAAVVPVPEKIAQRREEGWVHFDCPRYLGLQILCLSEPDGYIHFYLGRCMTKNKDAITKLRSKKFRQRYGIFEEDGTGNLYLSADESFWYSDAARLAHDKMSAVYGARTGYLPD